MESMYAFSVRKIPFKTENSALEGNSQLRRILSFQSRYHNLTTAEVLVLSLNSNRNYESWFNSHGKCSLLLLSSSHIAIHFGSI